MKKTRFWVIGGDFRDMRFASLRQPQISGPFGNRRDAYDEWRRLSLQTTHSATTRFSIAAE